MKDITAANHFNTWPCVVCAGRTWRQVCIQRAQENRDYTNLYKLITADGPHIAISTTVCTSQSSRQARPWCIIRNPLPQQECFHKHGSRHCRTALYTESSGIHTARRLIVPVLNPVPHSILCNDWQNIAGAGMLWAVFVQFFFVRQLHCASRPQHWLSFLTVACWVEFCQIVKFPPVQLSEESEFIADGKIDFYFFSGVVLISACIR